MAERLPFKNIAHTLSLMMVFRAYAAGSLRIKRVAKVCLIQWLHTH